LGRLDLRRTGRAHARECAGRGAPSHGGGVRTAQEGDCARAPHRHHPAILEPPDRQHAGTPRLLRSPAHQASDGSPAEGGLSQTMSSAINLKLGARKPAQAGKPDASAMEMERRIIWVRWLAILVSLGALPFLSSSLSHQSLVTLLALIGLGAIYNLTLLVIILPRKPGGLTSGYISAIGDTLLVTGGVAVTGGLESPFFLAYFVVTVTTAVRFGGLAAIVAVLTIALSYTAVVYYDNTVAGTSLALSALTNLAMRTGFVAITGLFVGFVGDRARRAERALEEELQRAHASLSEVTVGAHRDPQLWT